MIFPRFSQDPRRAQAPNGSRGAIRFRAAITQEEPAIMIRKLQATGVALALALAAATADANVVHDWNGIMLATVVGTPPGEDSRLAAITHLAMFEAVNTVTRDYEPYIGSTAATLQQAARTASPEAAAVAAAHRVLRFYVPSKAAALDAARDSSLAMILDGPAKQAGIALGIGAAEAMIALRTDDGSTPPRNYLPQSAEPGQWQLTPNCPAAGGVLLHLPDVIPFGIAAGSQFRAESPPRLVSRRYARDFSEVKRLGSADSTHRPQDRADVARFYAAVLGNNTWNPVATQLSVARGDSLTATARAYALLNVAINDALISVFDSKYHYTFWRPITAIRAGDSDGNPETRADPDFVPFIGTPCHPSYPSAHASAAGAAHAVLQRLYGEASHFITLSSAAVPGVSLTYTRLGQITRDIDDARIYGGIHFRFDQEAGGRQGRRVGTYVHRNLLRRVHDRGPPDCD
jgi:PAP2 superfamily